MSEAVSGAVAPPGAGPLGRQLPGELEGPRTWPAPGSRLSCAPPLSGQLKTVAETRKLGTQRWSEGHSRWKIELGPSLIGQLDCLRATILALLP